MPHNNKFTGMRREKNLSESASSFVWYPAAPQWDRLSGHVTYNNASRVRFTSLFSASPDPRRLKTPDARKRARHSGETC